ncbi:UNVERIFIED_CONTAM: Rab3 GTPase-activating protein catalytic subunit [Sesamum latifolium]|uniref:Rab3 GTPase-activating protein catalytic subunit n=1 Tax=Sesamum latifolium TaxID=2727402 RepID=A0AAW2T9U7_9LAMI
MFIFCCLNPTGQKHSGAVLENSEISLVRLLPLVSLSMAYNSNSKSNVDDDEEEEEFEHFDDFTVASSWERFISEIEAVCRHWLADGPKNLLAKDAVQMDLLLVLYKVIAPLSASGVVLDAPEASKLLSAVAIALSNCSCNWPAFVPVHDASRKAYIGIQNMGTAFTRRFESDCIDSQVPVKLMHMEGLYELFVSKFRFLLTDVVPLPKAYAAVGLSMLHSRVHFKTKLTYRTLTYEDEDEAEGADADISVTGEIFESEAPGRMQWDDDCPWSEWYSAEDPVKGFELLAIWSERVAESSLDMAELENASPLEADSWFLYPSLPQNLDISDGNTIGFASQLRLLVKALEMSLEAQYMEDFLSVEKSASENLSSSAVIPPPTVLDRVLKDLFHEVTEAKVGFSLDEHKSSRAIKGSPLDSLFGQFCLHALWFGNCNIRGILLAYELLKVCAGGSLVLGRITAIAKNVIKRSYRSVNLFDQSEAAHGWFFHIVYPSGSLAICINKKSLQGKGHDIGRHDDSAIADLQQNMQIQTKFSASHGAPEGFGNNDRKSSSGIAGPMMLLKSYKIMHAPITQDPPPMTEDMHEERLQAAEALGDSFSFSAQLEKDILASDMSTFKAANPDAVFEDFIRWHSPKDWESDCSGKLEESRTYSMEESAYEWPPQGRLSERMSDIGNSWRKIWNEALPLPASEQKPLLDPGREGEKVLHYLETLTPHQLLSQMVSTAFRAAADTLNQTSFGGLKQMTTKMGQLYITMASILKYMQSYNMTSDSEVIKDLSRLCVTFEQVEKLILLAASLHRKFLQSPHLVEAIFSDYHDYYLQEMATGSSLGDKRKEFDKPQEIQSQDRDVIAGMFTPPTAAQSWRKVTSMGNLLNGNEPISRELIFSKRDRANGSYFDSSTPKFCQQEIETYRMYVSQTSNDLRVALSVASCD